MNSRRGEENVIYSITMIGLTLLGVVLLITTCPFGQSFDAEVTASTSQKSFETAISSTTASINATSTANNVFHDASYTPGALHIRNFTIPTTNPITNRTRVPFWRCPRCPPLRTLCSDRCRSMLNFFPTKPVAVMLHRRVTPVRIPLLREKNFYGKKKEPSEDDQIKEAFKEPCVHDVPQLFGPSSHSKYFKTCPEDHSYKTCCRPWENGECFQRDEDFSCNSRLLHFQPMCCEQVPIYKKGGNKYDTVYWCVGMWDPATEKSIPDIQRPDMERYKAVVKFTDIWHFFRSTVSSLNQSFFADKSLSPQDKPPLPSGASTNQWKSIGPTYTSTTTSWKYIGSMKPNSEQYEWNKTDTAWHETATTSFDRVITSSSKYEGRVRTKSINATWTSTMRTATTGRWAPLLSSPAKSSMPSSTSTSSAATMLTTGMGTKSDTGSTQKVNDVKIARRGHKKHKSKSSASSACNHKIQATRVGEKGYNPSDTLRSPSAVNDTIKGPPLRAPDRLELWFQMHQHAVCVDVALTDEELYQSILANPHYRSIDESRPKVLIPETWGRWQAYVPYKWSPVALNFTKYSGIGPRGLLFMDLVGRTPEWHTQLLFELDVLRQNAYMPPNKLTHVVDYTQKEVRIKLRRKPLTIVCSRDEYPEGNITLSMKVRQGDGKGEDKGALDKGRLYKGALTKRLLMSAKWRVQNGNSNVSGVVNATGSGNGNVTVEPMPGAGFVALTSGFVTGTPLGYSFSEYSTDGNDGNSDLYEYWQLFGQKIHVQVQRFFIILGLSIVGLGAMMVLRIEIGQCWERRQAA